MSGRAGVDRLVASDADRDTLDCGADAPDEALVNPVGESSTTACERIVPVRPPASNTAPGVGSLSLTPQALHAKADRRLRLEVEAVEAGGARQVEPRAGSVRVHRRRGRAHHGGRAVPRGQAGSSTTSSR